MARTDAIGVCGLDGAFDRASAYAEAGADLLFLEGPRNLEELQVVPSMLSLPTMANMVPGGKTPIVSAETLQEWGYAMVAYPTGCSYAIAKTVREYFRRLLATGTTANMEDLMLDFDEFNEIVGLGSVHERVARYEG